MDWSSRIFFYILAGFALFTISGGYLPKWKKLFAGTVPCGGSDPSSSGTGTSGVPSGSGTTNNSAPATTQSSDEWLLPNADGTLSGAGIAAPDTPPQTSYGDVWDLPNPDGTIG